MATRPSSNAGVRLAELLGRLGAKRSDARPATSLAERHLRLSSSNGDSADRSGISLITAVAEVLGRQALDHSWPRPVVGRIVETLAEITRIPVEVVRIELQTRIARDPRIIELSPQVAIETELKVFAALTEADEVYLWRKSEVEGLHCVFSIGAGKPGRRTRLVARSVLESANGARTSASTHGVAVLRWQRPDAALVFSAGHEDAPLALAAARETSAALGLVLERESLLVRSAARERALVEGGERLLARLGFDLHDGPIQDVAALAGDLHVFRGQLEGALSAGSPPAVLVGRIDDLEARVIAVDRTLRDLVHSLESPTVVRRPLDEVLRREVEAFSAQSDIAVDLTLRGDFTGSTDSQRIAIVRIVQESLTNAREHSGATKVSISVARSPSEISVEITDNGRGFDVERTLVRAARNGRLGLIGMSERARLLGGRFDVRSRRGGATTVSVVLPAWRPATVEPLSVPSVEALSVG